MVYSATQLNEQICRRNLWLVLLLLHGSIVGCGGSTQDGAGTPTPEKTAAVTPVANPAIDVGLPWNFRPYMVKVWFVVDEQPRWTTPVLQRLCQDTSTQLGLVEPAAWRITAEVVPTKWGDLLGHGITSAAELPETLYDELSGNDKLIIVRVKDVGSGIEFSVNELDVNGWSLGPTFAKSLAEMSQLVGSVSDTIAQAFRPIVRLEHSEADIVTARVRAHGLMVKVENSEAAADGVEPTLVPNKSSPCWIESGEVFEPIVREANRQRKFELEKVKTLDFTLLVQQDAVEGPYVRAKIVSVNRPAAALGRKKGRNTEKFGIVVRTPPGQTKIRLFTMRGTSRRDLQEVPLNGYQIYSRSIYGTEDSLEYLGKTNWNGVIEIAPGAERVRLLLVKNGERNLARLPVMPGYKPIMEKLLPDDEDRILAEGIVSGLKSETLDLWARRQVLKERIRIALEKNEFAVANRYYELYRQMLSINQWNDNLLAYQQRLTSTEKRQQNKITAMFKELTDFSQKEFKLADDTKVQDMMLKARQERVGE
ncbi:MAG: hypothetical protein Q8M16_06880 [Pirellulaceae bacterium]|nr:hypothetical protein [Pirellulaceae bacterium]